MKIRVVDIPEEGFLHRIDDTRSSINLFDEEVPVLESISGSLFVKVHEAGRVHVKGNVRVVIELTCSRCLKTYSFVVEKSIDEDYYPIEDMPFGERTHLSMEDLDTCYYSHGEIDLESIYMEQIYLAIPMKPLCDEDCKGICPVCGKDLNEGPCGCSRGIPDPRWESLIELKEKLKKE